MSDTLLYNNGLGTVPAAKILVTPTGGTQAQLGALLEGIAPGEFTGNFVNQGTVQGGFIAGAFGSITPAGSNQATGTPVTTQTTVLGTAASTTGVDLPPGTTAPIGVPLLLLNQGTAAVHVYGGNTVDTIDSTAGTTGVSLTNAHRCFFTQISNNGTTGVWVSGPEGGVTS